MIPARSVTPLNTKQILFSFQPHISKWWWIGAILKMRLPCEILKYSTARGLEQVPSRRLSAVPAEEAASEAARRGKRRGRIKYRIFTLGLGLDMTMLFLILVLLAVGLVMMFSASYAYAYYYYGNSYYFILRQGMFALVGP